MIEIQPPSILKEDDNLTVFLAGSIEQGKAKNWQQKIVDEFDNDDAVTFYNPRRNDWDDTWEQEMGPNEFTKQVAWELAALEKADMVVMLLDGDTQACISLLEFGLYAKSGKLIVCCEEGFWRKGNVDITCARYHIDQVDAIYGLIDEIRRRL
jgi:hypothetical protein